MSWFDVVIVLAVVWFTFSAFQAGFIREIVTVVAAILGVILAGLFYKDLADDVLRIGDNETLSRIISFVLVFGVTALAGQMLALVLKPTVALMQLGIFDQMLGAVFGFFKALVFVEVFILVFITYPKWGIEDAIDESLFGSLMAENILVLERILPDEFEIGVDDFIDRL